MDACLAPCGPRSVPLGPEIPCPEDLEPAYGGRAGSSTCCLSFSDCAGVGQVTVREGGWHERHLDVQAGRSPHEGQGMERWWEEG